MTLRNGVVEELHLPAPRTEVVTGVRWGRFDEFFTPAFWRARLWIDGENSPLKNYVIGRSLQEEVAACLLGGFGMPAEMGLAAFDRLLSRGLLNGMAGATAIEKALSEPLLIGTRFLKYRYPATKSRFLSVAMQRIYAEPAPLHSAQALRLWLMSFNGIGAKTASWITRNFMHSDEVAILDVHIIRAGLLMGLFSSDYKMPQDYFWMEERLIAFAEKLDVRLSEFDSVLWCYMRQLNDLAIDALAGLPPAINPA